MIPLSKAIVAIFIYYVSYINSFFVQYPEILGVF